jgi:hypothetical protein
MNDQILNNDTVFNEEFCTFLEYHLCQTFKNFELQDIKDYWCDGISWDPTQPNQLTIKNVCETRRIVTEAWIGSDGQDKYEMTVNFGEMALKKYRNGNQMIDCIPSSQTTNWIDIDPNDKKIEIKLK